MAGTFTSPRRMKGRDWSKEEIAQKMEYAPDCYNPREDAQYYSSGRVEGRVPTAQVRRPENVFTTGHGRTRVIF